jgi:hypothetical protein
VADKANIKCFQPSPCIAALLQKLRQLDGSRSSSLAKLRADQKAERGKVRLSAALVIYPDRYWLHG